jgi:hypothetical protein
MTTQVAATAHHVARHDPAVAGHPWLAVATEHCIAAIRAIDAAPHAYELKFALQFLDAAADREPEARDLLVHLGQHLPPEGSTHVDGGTADERLHALDFAPFPVRPVRDLFTADVIAADLQRLAGLQQPDGGWVVDFASSSPAGALEWRGYTTLRAVEILRTNAP